MRILALDFSSDQRGVAILANAENPASGYSPGMRAVASEKGVETDGCNNTDFRVSDLPVICGKSLQSVVEVVERSRSRTMRPFGMISEALKQASLDREEIDCMVVGLGPGSYTGIRAAIAVAQGWQLARGIKLLGISSADAIAADAHAEGLSGQVNVVIDAQRGEFYVSTWEFEPGNCRQAVPLRLVSREEVEKCCRAGETLVGPEVTQWFPQGQIVFPRAATLARLAGNRNDFIPGEALEPIYLREAKFIKAPPPRVLTF